MRKNSKELKKIVTDSELLCKRCGGAGSVDHYASVAECEYCRGKGYDPHKVIPILADILFFHAEHGSEYANRIKDRLCNAKIL